MAQSVQQLAADYAVQGSNLGEGKSFRTGPDWPTRHPIKRVPGISRDKAVEA